MRSEPNRVMNPARAAVVPAWGTPMYKMHLPVTENQSRLIAGGTVRLKSVKKLFLVIRYIASSTSVRQIKLRETVRPENTCARCKHNVKLKQ